MLNCTGTISNKLVCNVIEREYKYCSNSRILARYERYKFNNREQKTDERIDTYATVLRDLASSCNYGALKEEIIRDRIVCGITNSAVRKKLFQIPDLTYDKCMDVCRTAEATEMQLSEMKNTEYLPDDDINAVIANSRKKPPGNESAKTAGGGGHGLLVLWAPTQRRAKELPSFWEIMYKMR